MKKSITFAATRMTPPFFWGGAEKSNLTLGLRLSKQDIHVSYYGSYSHFYKDKIFLEQYKQFLSNSILNYSYESDVLEYKYVELDCFMTSKENYLEKLRNYFLIHRPDLVITMLENASEIISLCKELGIPCILWVMDTFPISMKALHHFSDVYEVIFSSNFLFQKLSPIISDKGIVLPPLIEPNWYISSIREPNYITFINPIYEKGVDIFIEIATKLQIYEFLVVDSWRDVKLSFPPNVTHLPRQMDMKKIYGRTKLLLVPSVCEEAFGRVIVEAGLNAIPSVASRIGGIPEAVLSGGILVEERDSLDSWIYSINKILSNNFYAQYSINAYQSALKNSRDWTNEFITKYL